MTTNKHLAKGDDCPPLADGVLRCYSMRFCPWAQRTRLVLEHKKIPHEIVNVNLRHKPRWLFERNPLGLVPILEKNGQIIFESTVTCQWLEDLQPQPSLLPADKDERCRQLMLTAAFDKVAGLFHSSALVDSEEKREQSKKQMLRFLDFFEKELKSASYFGGESVQLADFMIWPWFERMHAQEQFGMTLLPAERYPLLRSWMLRMLGEPAVQATIITPELHLAWMSAFRNKEFVYDFPEQAKI